MPDQNSASRQSHFYANAGEKGDDDPDDLRDLEDFKCPVDL